MCGAVEHQGWLLPVNEARGQRMSSRHLTLADYDERWPARFEAEKRQLVDALGDGIVDCLHIGSTAVPGLAVKPVIDMLLIVAALSMLDRHQSVLAALEYLAKGENGIAGRRYFYKGAQVRRFHLHAYEPTHPDIVRHLAFRDYLRNHPEIAKEYQEVKRQALIDAQHSSKLYAKFKAPFIQRHEAIALALVK